MNKKTRIRVASYALFAVMILTGFWMREAAKVNYYEQQLENDYSYALYELNAGLNNISIILEKSRYLTDAAMLSETAAKLYSEAELSKTALSRLPIDTASSGTVGRFLSQVGNYSLSIARNAINGTSISNEQTENLALLSKTAATIAQTVGDTQLSFNNHEYWARELESKLNSEEIDGDSLASSLSSLEENLTDFPTLIYDGPFSEHLLKREPLLLKDEQAVTREQAEKLARSVVPQAGQFSYTEIPDSEIALHSFENDTATVSISMYGGYLVYLRANRFVSKEQLSYSQALSKAQLFLNQLELVPMKASYYFTDNGVCVINFTALNGNVICYPDLVKVGVALDNGEIVFYEGEGYIYNHTERKLSQPVYSEEEARATLNPELEPSSTALALIPTDGGSERLCYEFTCKTEENRELLIYINAETLAEERILILLKNDGGVLVK